MFRALLVFLLLTFTNVCAASSYTQAMYRRALGEEKGSDELVIVTTAPPYVLITLQEPRARSSRIAAIAGQSLLDAVAIEHHLPDNDAQWKKRFQIAVAQPERVFSFSNPKARRIVRPAYTLAMLKEVRQFLSNKSRSELIRELKANKSSLHSIYESKSGSKYWAYQAAIAHFCLEKGVLVTTGGCYGTGLGIIEP